MGAGIDDRGPDARSRIPDCKFDAKTLKFFLDFQMKSDLKLFGTQHK